MLSNTWRRPYVPENSQFGKKGPKNHRKSDPENPKIRRKKITFYSKSLNSQNEAIKNVFWTILDHFDPFLTLRKFFEKSENPKKKFFLLFTQNHSIRKTKQ